MFFFRTLCALLVSAALLTGCTGTGVEGKDAVLGVAAQARPNTAYVFWPDRMLAGLERLAFYQDDKLVQSVSGGQVATLPLSAGITEYVMQWEEVMEIPSGTTVTFPPTPDRPQFYVVAKNDYILLRTRSLQEVSRQDFLTAIAKAYRHE